MNEGGSREGVSEGLKEEDWRASEEEEVGGGAERLFEHIHSVRINQHWCVRRFVVYAAFVCTHFCVCEAYLEQKQRPVLAAFARAGGQD